MLKNEFTHLIDGMNAVQVAITLRHPPGEQTVATKNQAFRSRIVLDRLLNHERQFESGTLPRDPNDSSIKFFVELFELVLAICARCHGDSPVGMQMVYVRKRKEGVQRGIDGCGDAILAKGREWIVANHLILVLL